MRKGERMSQEQKDKISKANSGKNHWLYGKKMPEAQRQKIADSLKDATHGYKKGNIPWMLGRKHTDETKRKVSESKKGVPSTSSTKFQEGHSPWNTNLTKETDSRVVQPWLGKERSEETKQKIGNTSKGKRYNPEGEFKKGEKHPNFGKSLPEETKRKIGEANSLKKRTEAQKKHLREWNLEHMQAGNRGTLKHQKLVAKIAKYYDDGLHKVEVETVVKTRKGRHRRIIDVLVDEVVCIEIGGCKQNKIQELHESGYQVIHLPYSVLGGWQS